MIKAIQEDATEWECGVGLLRGTHHTGWDVLDQPSPKANAGGSTFGSASYLGHS